MKISMGRTMLQPCTRPPERLGTATAVRRVETRLEGQRAAQATRCARRSQNMQVAKVLDPKHLH